MLVENQMLFAHVVHYAFQNPEFVTDIDEFIFNIISFVFEPNLGLGFESGIFGFLRELLELDIRLLVKTQDFFEKNSISMKFLTAYIRRPEC